ncbi:MAG: LysR family transcriptional regulator [Rubrivivax sp.]|nr:LysR family transcriptional regulator [Rubrivivax sp.]
MSKDLRRLDWTLIRSFLSVMDAGSVMGAARKTGAQQPTLSRHLAELEAQLGVALFERTGRAVKPTQAAMAILDAARQMQTGADSISRALLGRAEQTTGTVRITTSEVAASFLLPPILAALRMEEPGIEIELISSNEISNLLRREADIAVRMVRPAQGSLVARKLGMIGIGAYAHEQYLERAGRPVSPQDLRRHSLVGYAESDVIERGSAALGMPLTRSDFATRTDDQVAYMRLVNEGVGIGFVTHYSAKLFPGLRRVLPMLAIPPLPCWLAVHREIRGNAVVKRVYEHLARAVPISIDPDAD